MGPRIRRLQLRGRLRTKFKKSSREVNMQAKIFVVAACGLLLSTIASASDIKVLSSGAVKEIYEDLAPQFEKSTGHKLITTWSGTALIREQLGTGEPFDLVIISTEDIDKFTADGKVMSGSRVDLAKSGV